MRAIAAVPANPDALPELEAAELRADFFHPARDFMPTDERIFHPGPVAVLENRVAVANAARIDLNENFPVTGLGNGTFHEFERAAFLGDLGNEHST